MRVDYLSTVNTTLRLIFLGFCVILSVRIQKSVRETESMAIIKNEIPILEFDTEQTAVINPAHEKLDLKLPRKCVFAFLGEYISNYASTADAVKVSLPH